MARLLPLEGRLCRFKSCALDQTTPAQPLTEAHCGGSFNKGGEMLDQIYYDLYEALDKVAAKHAIVINKAHFEVLYRPVKSPEYIELKFAPIEKEDFSIDNTQ